MCESISSVEILVTTRKSIVCNSKTDENIVYGTLAMSVCKSVVDGFRTMAIILWMGAEGVRNRVLSEQTL